MSILIKGMKMPKAGETIIIAENVDRTIYGRLEHEDNWYPLIEVPAPHGRLGDLNKLIKHIDDKYWDSIWIKSTALSMIEQEIRNAPTVIEVEE